MYISPLLLLPCFLSQLSDDSFLRTSTAGNGHGSIDTLPMLFESSVSLDVGRELRKKLFKDDDSCLGGFGAVNSE
jgi:hypothetical protein